MTSAGKESRPLNGVLVIDKPEGPTSHDVVTLARRALGVSRIGHTGTLDPMATGVLPLVVGKATRLAQFLTASEKTYEATVAFGRATDTYDALGRVVAMSPARPSRDEVETVLSGFRGVFEQTPPAFSAKNIDGERAYALARKSLRQIGPSDSSQASAPLVAARPKAVSVTAHQMDLASFDVDTARLTMRVSAGFYVRALAHDLGEALGCGAVLVALRRLQSGEFGLDRAVPLADVLQTPRAELGTRLVPMAAVLRDLPAVVLRGAVSLERLKNGVEMGPEDILEPLAGTAPIIRLLGPDGGLVALAKPGKAPGFLHGWVVLGV
jgi:tRNA pseudouridine55 synthase